MTRNRNIVNLLALGISAVAACVSAWANPIVVQPGSPAIYKYIPAGSTGSGANGAPWTDVCVPATGSVTPPTGTARVEAILVGGGGAGAPASGHLSMTNGAGYFFTGGGGGSGEVKVISFPYTTGAIQIEVGAGAQPRTSGQYMSATPTSAGTTTLAYQSVSYTAGGGAERLLVQGRSSATGGSIYEDSRWGKWDERWRSGSVGEVHNRKKCVHCL